MIQSSQLFVLAGFWLVTAALLAGLCLDNLRRLRAAEPRVRPDDGV